MVLEEINEGPWTKFDDMFSGGHKNTAYWTIYIQADENTAATMFENQFSESPYGCNCDCCIANYFIKSYDTLEEATYNDRQAMDGLERISLMQYITDRTACFILRDGTRLTFEEDDVPDTDSEKE